PTLHIKEEERLKRKMGVIHKGSGGVITTSTTGDAKYLEIDGSSVDVGLKMIQTLRAEVLQTTGAVLVEPDTTGTYKSGEALQLLGGTMETKGNRLRVTLTQAMREISRIFLHMGKVLGVANIEDENPGPGILLPPVVRQKDVPQPAELDEINDAITSTQEVGT